VCVHLVYRHQRAQLTEKSQHTNTLPSLCACRIPRCHQKGRLCCLKLAEAPACCVEASQSEQEGKILQMFIEGRGFKLDFFPYCLLHWSLPIWTKRHNFTDVNWNSGLYAGFFPYCLLRWSFMMWKQHTVMMHAKCFLLLSLFVVEDVRLKEIMRTRF